MLALFLTLAAIALVDSLSMVPLAVVPMTVALGGKRPLAHATAFVAGIFIPYFLCGGLLLAGTEFLFETFGAYLARLWNRPNVLELSVQIVIGVVLLGSVWYLRKQGTTTTEPRKTTATTPRAMFLLGATLVLVGLPGAVPYVAAIERIARFAPGWGEAAAFLAFYNLMFVMPFVCLIGVRFLMPRHAEYCFRTVADVALKAMPHIIVLFFVLTGVVLVADGIGWFVGYPLIPVSSVHEHGT
jgi:cytochrome c biogenesis protein CcdA